MLEVNAKVAILDNATDQKISSVSPFDYNNISEIMSVVENTTESPSYFSLTDENMSTGYANEDASRLDSTFCFAGDDDNNCLICLPDINTTIPDNDQQEYKLNINMDNIATTTQFGIQFDSVSNIYPTIIKIKLSSESDDKYKVYYNNSSTFFVDGLGYDDTYNILMYKLNVPYCNLAITGVYSRLSFDINTSNIISIDCEKTDRTDTEQPSFGVVSSAGTIEFIDNNGTITSFSRRKMLGDKTKVYINLVNHCASIDSDGNPVEKSNAFNKYIAKDWEYDNYTKVVTVRLEDEAILMQNSKCNTSLLTNFSKDLYVFLQKQSTSYGFIDYDSLPSSLKTKISNYNLNSGCVKADSLWAGWQQFCEYCMLKLYFENGNPVFSEDL